MANTSNLIKVPINQMSRTRKCIDHIWQNLTKFTLFTIILFGAIQIIIQSKWSEQSATIIAHIYATEPNMDLNISLKSHLNMDTKNVTKKVIKHLHKHSNISLNKHFKKHLQKFGNLTKHLNYKNHPRLHSINRNRTMSLVQGKRHQMNLGKKFRNFAKLKSKNNDEKPMQFYKFQNQRQRDRFLRRGRQNRTRKPMVPILQFFNDIWFIKDNVTMYENTSEILNPTHLNFTILKQRYNTYISSLKPLKNKNGIIDDINPEQTRCKHKGKVFAIGINKSGTTTINAALELLGYSHNKTYTIWYGKPRVFGTKYNGPFLYFRHFYDVMNVFFMNKGLMNMWKNKAYFSYNFGDSPACFFYEVYDKLFPNSKFILMRRSSTWSIVNSNMKYAASYGGGKSCDMYTYKFRGISSWDFAHWIAMRYELHNQRVIDYFNKTNRIGKDLLILDMESMIKENVNGTQLVWGKIMEFLGCDDRDQFSINTEFPHKNTGQSDCKVLVPKDYDLDWKKHFNYTIPLMYYPTNMIRIIHLNESVEDLL